MSTPDKIGHFIGWLMVVVFCCFFMGGCYENVKLKRDLRGWKQERQKFWKEQRERRK